MSKWQVAGGKSQMLSQPVNSPISQTTTDLSHLRFDIRFDDVRFAYPSPNSGRTSPSPNPEPTDGNGRRPALQGFSLTIPHGQTVAVVGATGAGKTTVANLLLRFVEPDAGRLTVGGVPLQDIDRAVWRRRWLGCRSRRTCSTARSPTTSAWRGLRRVWRQ